MTTLLRTILRSRVGLVLALLADFLLWGGPHRPHEAFPTSYHAAAAAQARITADFIDLDGVVGTAVGLDQGGNHVVKVYLTAMGVAALPATFAGVDVVPEVTGRFLAGEAAVDERAWELAGSVAGRRELSQSLSESQPWPHPGGAGMAPYRAGDDEGGIDRKAIFPRPVPIGVSAGHAEVTAGTIGARVTDGVRIFALSNNHVFAASNAGKAGDPVYQPGALDGGGPDQTFGKLHDFEPIASCRLGFCPANLIDAAVAVTTARDLDRATPEDGYGTPRAEPADAKLGMGVQKYGRTTGHTKGRITGINATIDVSYRVGVARFRDQVVIAGGGFGNPGDSGSLIVSDGLLLGDRRPVALLFAGSSTSTIANPIGLVLERFGVTVDGG